MESEIAKLIERGALFAVNHSAGKDSQAMYLKVRAVVPAEQIVVVHADLGNVEWDGCVDHIKATIRDEPLIVCRNERKTFLEMVAHRGMFPSPQQRQCTSDLKRNPIERELRRHLAANPRFGGLLVNCMGLRADESPNRAKAKPFKFSERNSLAGREWYDWLPIHAMTLEGVFKTIAEAGQKPHEVYGKGMKRLSCKLCVMATDDDLTIAARLDPWNYKRYADLERATGRTMMMPRGGVPRFLEEIVGINPDQQLIDLGHDPFSPPPGYEPVGFVPLNQRPGWVPPASDEAFEDLGGNDVPDPAWCGQATFAF